MTNRLRKLIGSAAALSLAATPIAASAGTRAGGAASFYSPANFLHAGTFPQTSWFVSEEDEPYAAFFQWLFGGSMFLAANSLIISNEPGASTPSNQSNGAN